MRSLRAGRGGHGESPSLCKIKAITGDKLQLVWAKIQPEGAYVMHSHPHEQFGILLQGRMKLRVGDEERVIGPGDIWYAPPNTVHGGELLSDEPVIFVDVFHPVREDVVEEIRTKRAQRLGGDGPENQSTG